MSLVELTRMFPSDALREAAAAHDLARLVMRLHEETDNPELRRRVLDVIDNMLRFGFLGMNDRLGQEYDR